ncbi:MAG: hypothetical protein PUI58_03405, partial [Solobacterium sp.]|nr:hypothetical protein [Solobacterium sp.]
SERKPSFKQKKLITCLAEHNYLPISLLRCVNLEKPALRFTSGQKIIFFFKKALFWDSEGMNQIFS